MHKEQYVPIGLTQLDQNDLPRILLNQIMSKLFDTKASSVT